MARKRKWRNYFVLKGNYGYGYEDLTAEDTYKEIRQRYKDYAENEPRTPLKIVRRKELLKVV